METERQKKIFLLRVLVIGAAVLIIAAWIFNLESELGSANKAIDENSSQEAADLRADVDETIRTLEEKIEKLKESAASSTAVMPDQPASTTIAATSTSIVEPCPEYINCMPTIGESRPCKIPAGCEGKTIIAY